MFFLIFDSSQSAFLSLYIKGTGSPANPAEGGSWVDIDPREEKPTVATWVVHPILKMVGAFEESVKKYPLIPMGTPDLYTPPAK